MATSAPSGNTRRAVAEVQGTQRLLACCCCAPFETQHQRAYRVSSETSRTYPPTYSTVRSRAAGTALSSAVINRNLIVIGQLELPGVCLRPLFRLGQRHAQLQDLLTIARHLPVPRDAPPREIAPVGGELASHSPIRHANYWSSRVLRQSCLALSVLRFILPPDESATPFSRQARQAST
jgi:hypothetical protein